MLAWIRTPSGATCKPFAWDIDVKNMFFIMCLRSLLVRALEQYSKDPGSSPRGDACFHVNKNWFPV